MSKDLLYCFPLADVLLCMDAEQDGRVCVCKGWGRGGGNVWGGGRGGEENSVIYVICIKLCILPPKRISCTFPRDIARKQVKCQMISPGIKRSRS